MRALIPSLPIRARIMIILLRIIRPNLLSFPAGPNAASCC